MPIAALLEGQGTNLWEVVLHGGPVAKGVLVLLAGFSILSWVVIIQKVLLLNRSRKITDQFRAAFRRATDWRDLKQASGTYTLSPLLGLFGAGYTEVTYQLRAHAQPGGKAQIRSMEAVERSLQRASVVEMGRMEKGLGILATIAAVSPFVGLFGTVWGIYHALISISASGAITIEKVSGPVGEALVMTAAGLAVAIPAVLA